MAAQERSVRRGAAGPALACPASQWWGGRLPEKRSALSTHPSPRHWAPRRASSRPAPPWRRRSPSHFATVCHASLRLATVSLGTLRSRWMQRPWATSPGSSASAGTPSTGWCATTAFRPTGVPVTAGPGWIATRSVRLWRCGRRNRLPMSRGPRLLQLDRCTVCMGIRLLRGWNRRLADYGQPSSQRRTSVQVKIRSPWPDSYGRREPPGISGCPASQSGRRWVTATRMPVKARSTFPIPCSYISAWTIAMSPKAEKGRAG